MLISDKLIFVELQKTGSTHIKGLLRKLVGGENDGKHNVPSEELLGSGKKFVASVRDPWAWYLSLWSYGCLQKGELYERLTNEKKWRKLLDKADQAAAEPAEAEAEDDAAEDDGDVATKAQQKEKGKGKILPDNFTPERAKNFWYADPDNAEAFREWLQAVLTVQPLRKVLEAGYGKSPISKAGGLMTFRYFTLCTKNGENVDKSVSTLEALRTYDKQNCFIDYFVRNASLAEDLIKAIEGCGIELDDEKKKVIREARKTNVSSRPHGPEHYYDDASVQLVARREKFIIEKFGYKSSKP
jgi:hypothetical protein